MNSFLVELLRILAPLSVALIVFAQGLGISARQVLGYWKERPAIMVRTLAVVLLLVPASAMALILLLKPTHAVAIALAIMVSCPPAPLMLKTAPTKGGASAAYMASMHLTLAALAALTVPAALRLLSMPLGFEASVDPASMAWTLARSIVLPLLVGIALRAYRPTAASRFAPALSRAGTVGLLVVVLFALVAFYPALLHMDAWSYAVIAAVAAVALAIGHFLGPHDAQERTSLAVECAVRHPVLAIGIAATTFGNDKALPVLVPCVITCIAVALIYLAARGRRLRRDVVPA